MVEHLRGVNIPNLCFAPRRSEDLFGYRRWLPKETIKPRPRGGAFSCGDDRSRATSLRI